MRHLLANVDPEESTADCSACEARVRVYRSLRADGSSRWRCSNRVKAQTSRMRERDPLLERVRKLVSKGVKITVEEFVVAVQEADDHCQLCGVETSALVVDHDHQSGQFRGMLCNTCNIGLGKFGDSPERLEEAVAYLRASHAKTTS